MPKANTERRSRTPALTRDGILAAAVEVIERDGPGALSMRRLGAELGVDATAFYRHFRDKDDLVLACYERVTEALTEAIHAVADDESWRGRLWRLARATWDLSTHYPATFSLGFARTTGGSTERELVEFILDALTRTGLPREQVVLYYRMFGDAVLSLSGMNAVLASLDPDQRAKDAVAWSGISALWRAPEYPAARQHATELLAVEDREIFEATVNALLDSIEHATT